MSQYTRIIGMINLERITDAQLIKLRDVSLDIMLSDGEFEEITIDGEVKTPEQQVEMLKDAITAILVV